MAVISSAVENKVTSKICRIPCSNQSIDVQRPVEVFILFGFGDFNREDLQSDLPSSMLWDGSKRIAHGPHSCNKDSVVGNLLVNPGETIKPELEELRWLTGGLQGTVISGIAEIPLLTKQGDFVIFRLFLFLESRFLHPPAGFRSPLLFLNLDVDDREP